MSGAPWRRIVLAIVAALVALGGLASAPGDAEAPRAGGDAVQARVLIPRPFAIDPDPGTARARAGLETTGEADGYVAAARRRPRCRGRQDRMLRSGPNKYAIGWCRTRDPRAAKAGPRPRARLLRELAFASLIADSVCQERACSDAAAAGRATWVVASGSVGVRPRTITACPRYRNVDFETDRPVPQDRLRRDVPAGRQVLWRYATRGGGWVMVHWGGGGDHAWAFVPRSCVADPPTWTTIGLWRDDARRAGRGRPTAGRTFRVLRPALPCPSRLRCRALR